MAKRRRLEAPSAEDLSKLEEEFRRETPDPAKSKAGAPIAQVAKETAEALTYADPTARAAQARNAADAETLRKAQADGLVMLDIPLSEIDADSMVRDRSVMDREALDELERSIAQNGMRLPVEVYALAEGAHPTARYGLLSGYRRLFVLRRLYEKTGVESFATVRAIERAPAQDADRFAAMVEENEIRQQLTHYERGRIAAIAAKQGVFANTEAAVAAMFPAASKAKRSKIRSFAMIFEELGDILQFPENLREKDGLRIASALRDGAEERLREVLDTGQGSDAASEWDLIEATLDGMDEGSGRKARGGRPKVHVPKAGWVSADSVRLSSGITLRKGSDSKGYSIHISGKNLSADLMDSLFDEIRAKLEAP
ncbi:ParB N-terminal domain-containing protein [Nereida sp. MMG025]|uniref:ParB/RepB/Spo0J family partition protein n=1 Tax=Nereida sp. MMG025 TaxID=2909981 RepID=UPI001F1DD1DD|nr:ParB N-terminal domain-containing protein [Nereida sp. MMG025]MCF6445745.1 ParB N-terminal domain-containing protein [Nereida sp. MMG025]